MIKKAVLTGCNMFEMAFRVIRLIWWGRIDQVRHYVQVLEGYQVYLNEKEKESQAERPLDK